MLFIENYCEDVGRRDDYRAFARLIFGLVILCGPGIFLHSTCAAEAETPADAGAVAANSPPRTVIEAAIRDDFLVLPIRTELQRATGRAYDKARVFVLINGVKVIKGEDEALDATALRLSKIWEAIEAFTEGEPGNVVFRVWCRQYARRSRDDGTWPASSILMDALEQFGRDVGFQEAHVDLYFLTPHHKYADDWRRAVADVAPRPGEGDVDEPGVGDEHVKLYPVRTRFSRLLYHGADCVVQIVPPIDEVDVAAAIKTMKRCLPQLGLKKKERVLFLEHWRSPEIANVIGDEVMGRHVYRDLLGFGTRTVMVRN